MPLQLLELINQKNLGKNGIYELDSSESRIKKHKILNDRAFSTSTVKPLTLKPSQKTGFHQDDSLGSHLF